MLFGCQCLGRVQTGLFWALGKEKWPSLGRTRDGYSHSCDFPLGMSSFVRCCEQPGEALVTHGPFYPCNLSTFPFALPLPSGHLPSTPWAGSWSPRAVGRTSCGVTPVSPSNSRCWRRSWGVRSCPKKPAWPSLISFHCLGQPLGNGQQAKGWAGSSETQVKPIERFLVPHKGFGTTSWTWRWVWSQNLYLNILEIWGVSVLLNKQGLGNKLLSLAGAHCLVVNSTVLLWLVSAPQDASAVEGHRPSWPLWLQTHPHGLRDRVWWLSITFLAE